MDDNYGHVLKYTGIFGGVQGLNIGIGLVRTKLVALLLGPSGMGLASLFNTTVNMVFQATNLGLPFSAVRRVSELYQEGDEAGLARYVKVVRGWTLLTALLGMFVCIVIGPFLSHSTFAWGDHTLHFVLLAPAVGMMTIASCSSDDDEPVAPATDDFASSNQPVSWRDKAKTPAELQEVEDLMLRM